MSFHFPLHTVVHSCMVKVPRSELNYKLHFKFNIGSQSKRFVGKGRKLLVQ